MTHYKPQSVREKGLQQHLGLLKYKKFRYHYDYYIHSGHKPNINAIHKATGWSWQTVKEYVEIHEEELADQDQTD